MITSLVAELIEYGGYPFVQRALLGGALIALNCALLGPFLVLQRFSLLSDGYGHIAFAGVALGLLIGIDPILSAFIVVLLGSIVIRWVMRHNVFGDAAIALLTSLGVGAGVILIDIARGFNVDLYRYLIGSIFTISGGDLIYIFSACTATLLYLLFFYRDLFMITFNNELASLSQRRYRLARNIFTILIAINVVITIRAVGLLLVSSMIVIPSLVALKCANSMKGTLLYSSATALAALIIGMIIALLADIPPSGAIVLLLFLFFVATHLGARKAG